GAAHPQIHAPQTAGGDGGPAPHPQPEDRPGGPEPGPHRREGDAVSPFTLRPAEEGDLPALLELYRAYHRELEGFGMPYALREEELERVLRLRVRSRLILTELALDGDGAPAGFVFCSILRLANEYLCEGS